MSRWMLALPLAFLASPVSAAEPKLDAKGVEFFETKIRPVLVQQCYECHSASSAKLKGGLRLDTRAGIVAGGDSGEVVVPGKPEASLLIEVMKDSGDQQMPPAPKSKLPAHVVADFEKWITMGAPDPRTDTGGGFKRLGLEESKSFWSFKPLAKPAVPQADAGWARTDIDRFVRAKLDEQKLTPAGNADRATLARRLYFDIIGLPPSPEQLAEFVSDKSPDAVEKLTDRLLASPQFGERWGRYWLDLARYAESNGNVDNLPFPSAWRFRDYVIASVNADKPYDQFIREQVAGDELEWNADAITATGFYRLGLWDDEPADRELAIFDGFDDLVTVTGQGFLGMTLNCARCHDHKVDPIPQTDYYQMVAFFRDIRPFSDTRGVNSSNNATDITPPEKRKVYEQELKDRDAAIKELERQMRPIENAAIKKMPPEDQLKVDDGKREEVVRQVPKYLEGKEKGDYSRLVDRRRQLLNRPVPSQEFTLSVNNCNPNPPPVHLLARGNPRAPAAEVKPAFPTVLGVPAPAIPSPKPGAKTSGRRSVLADWLASKSNPLTARVMVNRVWQYHFGRGIVPTANDFGKLGEQPSHPELLDWLASDFADNGWTLKRLHKLIMTSNVYQQTAKANDAGLAKDPANVLLWRFNMRRLAAEEVRDAILFVSGSLNMEMGGKSVYPKIPAEVLIGQSRPGEGWPTSPKEVGNRRSVYVHVKRALQVPVLIAHDQADTDSSCPVRYTTTVPTQALGLLNGEFANEQAAALADRLQKDAKDLESQVIRGIRLTTGRIPVDEEVKRDVEFVKAMKSKHGLEDRTALTRYALMLLNANEFVYLD